MLSPRREIPLPYVMTTYLDDPGTRQRHNVLQSSVWIEIENNRGVVITVKRNVVSDVDGKLISVLFGPALSTPNGHYTQRDFFVLDPGAAQREAGFHRFLAEFIGWQLPRVRRYDGSETQLYVETIFPLLYVEQKAGWSALPAALPSYFQIRDVARRSVEFLLGLSTHEIELRKQQLDLDLAANKSAWTLKREELVAIAGSVSARVEGLPTVPTISEDEIAASFLAVAEGDEWLPMQAIVVALRARVEEMRAAQVPTIEQVANEATAELSKLTDEYADRSARRASLFRAKQTEVSQSYSARRRLAALDEDLQKNVDAQKLRSLGSTLTATLAADHCPTCTQPIADTLLAQRAGTAVMPVEDNIEYIKAQRAIFQKLQTRSAEALETLNRKLAIETEKANEISARIRALRADLVSPSSAPSIAAIEDRLRLERRLQGMEDALQRFEVLKAALLVTAARHAELLEVARTLPADRFSESDKLKIARFTQLIRDQVAEYDFTTFPAGEIDISLDNFKPQKEGFEIGFELSASDAIRLKWAYQLALMELGRHMPTNHPGFVVFDEPRQQEAAKISFKHLLERAATAKSANQQVIFATSEERDQLERMVAGIHCRYMAFEGFILQRI